MKASTQILVALNFLFIGLTPAISQSDTINTSADVFFAQLDTSRIPTGFLIDKAVGAGENFHNSTGSGGEQPELGAYEVLDNYWLLRESAVKPNTLPPTMDLLESAQDYLATHGDYPLIILDFDYSSIEDDAIENGLLSVTDDVLVDGPELNESPYQTAHFLNAGVLDSFMVSNAVFTIPSNLYFSNTGMPESLEIDFGDGNGFQEVNFDTPVSVTYGEYTPHYNGKEATFTLRLKKNGMWKSVSFIVQVVECKGANPPVPAPAPWGGQFGLGNISTNPFGVTGTGNEVVGNAYTYFRKDPAPGTENLYRRPFIIVEGFETGNYDPNKAENYRMGNLGWCQLWGGKAPERTLEDFPLDNMPDLLNELHDKGYDIIMLDFKDAKRSLKDNAALLVQLIKNINSFKTVDAEPNVVVGASAGGIIARYALAWMEQNEEPHCTRLYVSFDSPHKGAYLSLGALYTLDFLAFNKIQKQVIAMKALNDLGSPAGLQLLMYNMQQSNLSGREITAKSAEHLAFQNELANIGYPQNLKKVAVASGSQQKNTWGITPGAKLLDMEANKISAGLVAQLLNIEYFSPDAGKVFEGMVGVITNIGPPGWVNFIDHDTRWNSGGIFPVDNVPSGGRELTEQIRESIAPNLDGWNKIRDEVYYSTQAFVPTISALDLNTTDYFYDVYNAILGNNLPTPFDDVYAPNDNTLHVEITDGTITGKGDNIQYVKNKTYPGEPVSNPVLTSTYNYGDEFNSEVSHEEVKNGGKLWVYGNFADSESNNVPEQGHSQVYFLGSECLGGELAIGNNGEVIIGDQAAGNYATLHVRENATVRIKAGGKLSVEYGTLEIADGANFIFEDGAQIELPGYASVLKIKGKLSVSDNANFSFTGNGRLVFDQNIPWAQNAGTGTWYQELDDYWDIGQNASFTVEGSSTNPDYDHVLIEAHQPVSMKMEDGTTFGQVNIKYGRVALHDDAPFFVFSPVNLQFVKFNTAYSWQRHGGFMIFNNPGPNAINRCKFENGEVGAIAQRNAASTSKSLIIGPTVII